MVAVKYNGLTSEACPSLARLLLADLVLVDYDTLAREVHFDERLSRRTRMSISRLPNSLLLDVFWHRIVMDEAQMVKGGASQPSLMASSA